MAASPNNPNLSEIPGLSTYHLYSLWAMCQDELDIVLKCREVAAKRLSLMTKLEKEGEFGQLLLEVIG